MGSNLAVGLRQEFNSSVQPFSLLCVKMVVRLSEVLMGGSRNIASALVGVDHECDSHLIDGGGS